MTTTRSEGPKGRPFERPRPPADCPLCPRLAAYRERQRSAHPAWHNAPVSSFGPADAALAIVGLAPGVAGANRTGRPFTGDYAGVVLYPALAAHGFANDRFAARVDDGLVLTDCRITNAVRCVPPENKPTPQEIVTCRRFLIPELTGAGAPLVILALGRIAFDSVLRVFGHVPSRHRFEHGAVLRLEGAPAIVASYHCSRYNVNTGRLTPAMFDEVMGKVAETVRTARTAARKEVGTYAEAGLTG